MSKTKNSFLSFIPYFIGGFIIGMFVLNFDRIGKLSSFAPALCIMGLAVAVIFAALGMTGYFQLRKRASNRDENTDEDALDQYMYKKYADTSLYLQTGLVLSILVMAVAIIQQTDASVFTTAGITLVITLLFLFLLPTLLPVMYPERNLPSSADSNFTDKLLAASDEGERHVMLEGLYKTFNTMNTLLFVGLILLMMYSIATGDNQVFGMVVISAVMITANVKYVLSIRNKG